MTTTECNLLSSSGILLHDPANATTRFNYMKWQDLYSTEKPFQILIDIPRDSSDQRTTNVEFERGPVETVTDMRGSEFAYQLDQHGFQVFKSATCLLSAQFEDPVMISQRYLPECAELLRKNLDGADRIHIFGWRRRKSGQLPIEGKRVNFGSPDLVLGPATHTHVDQSPMAVVEMVRNQFPQEADQLLRGRIRVINLWRPINGPVKDWPLAVADTTTIPQSNLVEVDRIRTTYHGATYFLCRPDSIKWYYLSQQENNETLLLKIFDSAEGIANYCVHSAFNPEAVSQNVLPRESIEVRAIIFTYPTG